MELWALITVGSAFLQNLRSTLQKHLKGRMGTTGATFVRFGFGLPFAFLYLAILHLGLGRPLPVPGSTFAIWAVIGALAQITATFLLVHLFSFRNFAVGTAYSRTEPAQAALLALILFGETIGLGTAAAILVSILGVMLISVARTTFTPLSLVTSVTSRTASIGLASGFFFGISAIAYRTASLSLAPSLPAPDAMVQAGYTLCVVITIQTLSMLCWMAWRDQLRGYEAVPLRITLAEAPTAQREQALAELLQPLLEQGSRAVSHRQSTRFGNSVEHAVVPARWRIEGTLLEVMLAEKPPAPLLSAHVALLEQFAASGPAQAGQAPSWLMLASAQCLPPPRLRELSRLLGQGSELLARARRCTQQRSAQLQRLWPLLAGSVERVEVGEARRFHPWLGLQRWQAVALPDNPEP